MPEPAQQQLDLLAAIARQILVARGEADRLASDGRAVVDGDRSATYVILHALLVAADR